MLLKKIFTTLKNTLIIRGIIHPPHPITTELEIISPIDMYKLQESGDIKLVKNIYGRNLSTSLLPDKQASMKEIFEYAKVLRRTHNINTIVLNAINAMTFNKNKPLTLYNASFAYVSKL